MGFPGGSDGKESSCNEGDLGSIPGLGRSPGGGRGNPLQCSCLENPHGQRSLAGYSPWGCKQSDMTKHSTAQWMPWGWREKVGAVGVQIKHLSGEKEGLSQPAYVLDSGGEGAKLPSDCCFLLGDHACPEDDLARALLHLRGLQDTHSEQGLLYGGRGSLLRARYGLGQVRRRCWVRGQGVGRGEPKSPHPPAPLFFSLFLQTMRRCLAQNAEAVTSRLMLGTASWRRWASAGMIRASCAQ